MRLTTGVYSTHWCDFKVPLFNSLPTIQHRRPVFSLQFI